MEAIVRTKLAAISSLVLDVPLEGGSLSLLCILGCPTTRVSLDADFQRSLAAPRAQSSAGGEVCRRCHCGDFTGAKRIGLSA
jgi:hypothetical protein